MAGTVWTAAEAVNNPIRWIKTTSDGSFDLTKLGSPKYIKCPSAYSVEIDDISNSDAGRTASGTMVKSQLYVNNKPVRARALSIEWAYPSDADIAGILSILESAEYLYVCYYDPRRYVRDAQNPDNNYVQSWFYLGNRTSPMYNKPMGLWTSLATKLISRN